MYQQFVDNFNHVLSTYEEALEKALLEVLKKL